MKKFTFILASFLFFSGLKAQITEDVNVSLSNIASNNWFQSYDNSTKTVNDLNFMVLTAGTNSSNYVTPFVVKVYIWDGSNPHFVQTYSVNSANQMNALTFSNKTIDLSSLGLPAGTYRLGVYVDGNDDIPNPPDDPSDNAYLLPGNINFTPGGVNGLKSIKNSTTMLNVYPNPVRSELHIDIKNTLSQPIKNIEVVNVMGKVVAHIIPNDPTGKIKINVAKLPKGIYFVSIVTDNTIMKSEFIKK